MSAALGIGTATFLPGYGPTAGGRPAVHLLQSALDAGVRYLDTAAAYGDSEAAIGALADSITAQDVRVATKIQPDSWTPAAGLDAMRASLERLRLPEVDTVLVHSASANTLTLPEVGTVMSGLRAQGKARHFGASTYGAGDACAAAALPWCDAVQVEFSIVNQSVVDALRASRRSGVEVVVRSVLCKGLLTPAALGLSLPADAMETLVALASIAADEGLDLASLAIRFALDTDGIDVVLVGVSTDAELQTALTAWHHPPLSSSCYAALAAFDRRDARWSHPEQWPGGRPAA